jgi:3-hydroxyisobutyrate dehydrogenase
MLTDAVAVGAALVGSGDIACALAAVRPGAVVAQMSTIGPDEERRLAARLGGAVSFLDAPVGAANAGPVTIFAGSQVALDLASFATSLAANDMRLALRDVRTAPMAAAATRLLDAADHDRKRGMPHQHGRFDESDP